MKKKLFKNEEEINLLALYIKEINMYVFLCICISGHPNYQYQYINIKNIFCKIPKKYLIYAWKLSLRGNYALKIDAGRQTERQKDRKTERQKDRNQQLQ